MTSPEERARAALASLENQGDGWVEEPREKVVWAKDGAAVEPVGSKFFGMDEAVLAFEALQLQPVPAGSKEGP